MAHAVDGAEDELDASPAATADLLTLLKAGNKPWVVKPCPAYEIYLEFRRPTD